MFSFLSFCFSGASVIILLPVVSEAQYYGVTVVPDYEADYNATFDYSFYSNASSEDLDKFSERFIDQEQEVNTVTMATTPGGDHDDDARDAASLPVCPEIRTLLWTLLVLISLNTP